MLSHSVKIGEKGLYGRIYGLWRRHELENFGWVEDGLGHIQVGYSKVSCSSQAEWTMEVAMVLAVLR